IQAPHNNLERETKKVNEKIYAAQVGCEKCKGPHYTKDCPLKEEGKTIEEAYHTQFGAPFQGGRYRATAPKFYQRNNTNPSYQDMRRTPVLSKRYFSILEDMDAYRDEGMGDVIFGKLFLREVRINAKQFEGMITIHNGNDEVTYQMARSHLRFKHHTKEQCNKIPPLLKDLAESKEIDEVGEVSIIWNPMCIVVMLVSRRIYNTHPCS
ncbi:retrovirus-related pol polyprotein from transposon TNT 1-94, partial [Tanacetum coccineum]